MPVYGGNLGTLKSFVFLQMRKSTGQITQEQLEVIQQVVQEVVVDNRTPTVLLI